MIQAPLGRVIKLRNEICAYCGTLLSPDTVTEDHVIGRRFVPKGKLNRQWNLIVQVCQPCNLRKSDLEDDISAITMQPDLTGDYGHGDQAAIEDGYRKAQRAFSRRTKKPVKNSQEELTVEIPFGAGARFTFNFTAPPQYDESRVFELARLQLMAFFFWITFDSDLKRGRYWREGFYPLMAVQRADWGNTVMRAYADAVAGWEPRVLGCTAGGFFKIVIRHHPEARCWSWAVEWNLKTRVVDFFGDRAVAEAVAYTLPKLEIKTVSPDTSQTLHYRIETPLSEEEDRLFFWDDGAEGSGAP